MDNFSRSHGQQDSQPPMFSKNSLLKRHHQTSSQSMPQLPTPSPSPPLPVVSLSEKTSQISKIVSSQVGLPERKWYFTSEKLKNTPSIKARISIEKELSYRRQAANLIQ